MTKIESMNFFDKYPNFYLTSNTTSFPNRLNRRYNALIESNEKLIKNSVVLDLGSHDGRWSFAALKNQASRIIGIEGRKHLVENSFKNMKKYGIPSEKYSFIYGNIFQELDKIKPSSIDVVFCFGVFYHIMNHMLLISKIKKLNPKYLILDTLISKSKRQIIKIVEEDPENESNSLDIEYNIGKKVLVGLASKSALELMLQKLGFEIRYYDWHSVGIKNWEHLDDYKNYGRVSLVAKNV